MKKSIFEFLRLSSDHRGKAGGRCSLEVSYWEFVQNRGSNVGIGRCTAMNVKDEFCSSLITRANDFIKFPKTKAETSQTMQEFFNITRFPQVVGAIDGSNIGAKRRPK